MQIYKTHDDTFDDISNNNEIIIKKENIIQKYLPTCIITITVHNTFFVFLHKNQRIATVKSVGLFFKKKQRSLPIATSIALKRFCFSIKERYPYTHLNICFQGVKNKRKIICESLQNAGYTLGTLYDYTNIPFNGTKQKRKKR